jgi:hypothetical protein
VSAPTRRGFLGALLGGLASLKFWGPPKIDLSHVRPIPLANLPSREMYVLEQHGLRGLVDNGDLCEPIHGLRRTVTWTHIPPGTRPLLRSEEKKS